MPTASAAKKRPRTDAGREEASVIEKVTDLPAGSNATDEGVHGNRNREHSCHLLYESTSYIRNGEANRESWGLQGEVDQA